MPAPPTERALALEEALNFCAVPKCFDDRALDVHHINQVATDHRVENLVALCPTHHHAWCHRGVVHERLSTTELMGFKQKLRDLVPGRMRTGTEVLSLLQTYYEGGQFVLLEHGVFILIKALRRQATLPRDPTLVAKLNEYLGEIAILNGNAADASRYLFRATKLAEMNEEPDALSHCYGLVALDRVNWNDYRSAVDYIDRAVALLADIGQDPDMRLRRLGWLHHLHVSVRRHLGDASAAMMHIELAGESYSRAASDLNHREVADRALVRAMALSIADDEESLSEAYDTLASVEELVQIHGWLPTKARLRLQKVRLLLKMQDAESAREELALAWDDADKAKAHQYTEEVLQLVYRHPELCNAALLHAIDAFHGSCRYCSQSEPGRLARCALRTLAVRSALGP